MPGTIRITEKVEGIGGTVVGDEAGVLAIERSVYEQESAGDVGVTVGVGENNGEGLRGAGAGVGRNGSDGGWSDLAGAPGSGCDPTGVQSAGIGDVDVEVVGAGVGGAKCERQGDGQRVARGGYGETGAGEGAVVIGGA